MKFLLSALAIFLVSAPRYTHSTFFHLPRGPSGQVPLDFARTPVFREGRIPPFFGSPYEGSVLAFGANPMGRGPVVPVDFGGSSISLKSEPFYFGAPSVHKGGNGGCNHRTPGGFNVGGAGISGISRHPFAERESPAQSVDIVRFLNRNGATVEDKLPSVLQSFDRGPRNQLPVRQYGRR